MARRSYGAKPHTSRIMSRTNLVCLVRRWGEGRPSGRGAPSLRRPGQQRRRATPHPPFHAGRPCLGRDLLRRRPRLSAPQPRASGRVRSGGRSPRGRFPGVSTLRRDRRRPRAPPLSPPTRSPTARARTHPAAAAVPRLAHVLSHLVALVEAHGHRVAQSHGCRQAWGEGSGRESALGPRRPEPRARLPRTRSRRAARPLGRTGAPESGWQQILLARCPTNLLFFNGSRGGRAVAPRNSGLSSFRGSSGPERQECRALPLAAGGPAFSMRMR